MSHGRGTRASSDPVKAYFAIPGDLDTPSGGYGYAREVLRGAAAAGLDLHHVALPDGYPDPSSDDRRVCAEVLTKLGPDHPILIDGLALGAMVAEELGAIRAPLVALCHHPLAFETGVAPDRAAELEAGERAALEGAVAVITTSGATAEILRERYGVPAAKLTVAPPGTESSPRAAGSGGPGCAIVSVGSVTPRKGHRRLVSALAGMRDAAWTLRIIGAVPDPEELAALSAEIEQLDLADRVTVTGPMSGDEISAAYQTADLFVLASEYEGFGMAFVEAMANGLPVLGLDCPAVAEATRGAARLVAPDAFSAALETLVRRPDARAALSDACWQAAGDLPRWPATIEIIAGVLRAQSGFSPDWLALRQDADNRARSVELAERLASYVNRIGAEPLRVLDLGAGTGANLRALAPKLPGAQRWVLADNDTRLLNRARAIGQAEVETRQCNIATDLELLFDPLPDLVTASAFFDLCGAEIAEGIVRRTVAAGAAFFTVLTFDGREEWEMRSGSRHPAQDRIDAAFLQDQCREKGMGPALGPNGTDYLAHAFRQAGYEVFVRSSDWTLTTDTDGALIEALAVGHAMTAQADMGTAADEWLAEARKASAVMIGHQDLLALPPT